MSPQVMLHVNCDVGKDVYVYNVTFTYYVIGYRRAEEGCLWQNMCDFLNIYIRNVSILFKILRVGDGMKF